MWTQKAWKGRKIDACGTKLQGGGTLTWICLRWDQVLLNCMSRVVVVVRRPVLIAQFKQGPRARQILLFTIVKASCTFNGLRQVTAALSQRIECFAVGKKKASQQQHHQQQQLQQQQQHQDLSITMSSGEQATMVPLIPKREWGAGGGGESWGEGGWGGVG